MTGWIIFGAIVLLFAVVLRQSITVTVDYEKELNIKAKFLWFTIYTTSPKPKRLKKQKKQKRKKDGKGEKSTEAPKTTETENDKTEASTEEKAQEADKTASPKQKNKAKAKKLELNIEMIMDYVRSASPPIKRLFKKMRWCDIYVDWVVATEDAAKTALTYGMVCGFMYPFFRWLDEYFSIQVREINIEPDFSKEVSDIFIYFVLKLRLSTALASVIWLAVRALKTYLKYNPTQPARAKKGK